MANYLITIQKDAEAETVTFKKGYLLEATTLFTDYHKWYTDSIQRVSHSFVIRLRKGSDNQILCMKSISKLSVEAANDAAIRLSGKQQRQPNSN